MSARAAVAERATSPELRQAYPGAPEAFHFHIYEPKRKVSYLFNSITHKIQDFSGEDQVSGGYNERAVVKSYMRLLRGVVRESGNTPLDSSATEFLTNRHVSWNMFGVTADEIKYKHPDLWNEFHGKIMDAGIRPVGDTYFHPIFPLLPDETKRMLIRFAKTAYEDNWGHKMQFVWLPEMAVDQATLDILAEEEIAGVLLRRGQISANQESPVYSIKTKSGKSILAFVSDKDLSGDIAYHNGINADGIIAEWKEKARSLGHSPLTAMDGETFGEHWKEEDGSFQFLAWMMHHLQDAEQSGELGFKIALDRIPNATLSADVSSWSCFHGVDRWNGGESCNEDLPNNRDQQDIIHRQKRELYENIMKGIHQVDESLDALENASRSKTPWRQEFNKWFNGQRRNIALELPLEVNQIQNQEYAKLFLAEALLLIGTTSCGWFFGGEFERRLPREILAAVSELTGNYDLYPSYTISTLSANERNARDRFYQNGPEIEYFMRV